MSKESNITEILKDFIKWRFGKLNRDLLIKKYKISNNEFDYHRKKLVMTLGIEPLLIYTEKEVSNDPELKSKSSKENLKKPISEFLQKHTNISKEFTENLNIKATSTLLDKDGNVKLQWIKADTDKELVLDGIKKAITKLTEKIPPFKKIKIDKQFTPNKDLMLFLPIADLHLGLKIEKERVSHGIEWNLDIAKRTFENSTRFILENSPSASELVIADMGDLTHQADNNNVTPINKHPLDVDSSYEKTMLTLFEMLRDFICLSLQQFEKVYFYSVPGNHNDHISLTTKCVLRSMFANEKRFFVDINKCSNIYYHYFGKNIIGMTHGHELKPNCIESAFYTHNKKYISTHDNFDVYFGHYHQDKQFYKGNINVRMVKNMIPNDKWADSVGFVNTKKPGYIQSFLYHKNSGVISQTSYNPTF